MLYRLEDNRFRLKYALVEGNNKLVLLRSILRIAA